MSHFKRISILLALGALLILLVLLYLRAQSVAQLHYYGN